MFFPIKTRTLNTQILSFIENIRLEKQIFVPFLSDGCFELILAKNNSVVAKPIDDVFANLWEQLLVNPSVVSKMIEINDVDPSASLVLNKNKIVTSYNLLSLTKRSEESVLFNNNLTSKNKIFNEAYLDSLRKFKTTIQVGSYNDKMSVFQDLTYLTDLDKRELLNYDDCLFITKNKQDSQIFNNRGDTKSVGR